MAESLSLSLQAFPTPDKDKESLQYLIRRVNEQRGSFRNVTEQSLEDEIRALDAGDADESQEAVVETSEVDEDAKTKKEEVIQARDEIRKQVVQATQESQMALEFISLLLSRHAPTTAQNTMSPDLRKLVPLGSIGGEVVQTPVVPQAEQHNENMTVIGWRMQSLNGAVDSLLYSATRLEEEMGKEARYWEQVLAVKEKGWSLHRLPREKHTLGVRYGFAEAYSDFRERGLAALRRDGDGNLSLDRGIRSKGDRKLRVRILEQGKPIASNIRDFNTSDDEGSVEKEILKARNSLYDEELHHELDREARNLLNHGVRCINNSILLPYETGKQIELSLVSSDEGSFQEESSNDHMADGIAIALRILLSHAHRQNLQNRSRMPLPLREQKPPRPTYALLKPLLEYLQHKSYVESTQALLNELNTTLAAAGLDVSISKPTPSRNLELLTSTINHQTTTTLDTILQALTSSPSTTLTLTLTFLPTPTTLTITIHTSLQPPHYGTSFHLTTENPTPSTPMNTFPALYTHILDLLTLSLTTHLVSTSPSWRARDRTIHRTDPKTKDRETLTLTLSRDKLQLIHQREGKQKGKQTWTWAGDEAIGEERDLVAVFNGLGS